MRSPRKGERKMTEKKLMRVTYKQSPSMQSIGTVGRAQVLIDKDLVSYELSRIRRLVRSIMATLGNVRWYDKEFQDKAERLLDKAVEFINEVEGDGTKIVFLEVGIKEDESPYDYDELLQ
jgi:hypothetical protein